MRKMLTTSAALVLSLAMLAAPEGLAQTRRSSGATSARSSSSQVTRSSGSNTSTRSSAVAGSTRSAAASPQVTRSTSGSTTRSTSGSQATRGTSSSQVTRSNSGTTTSGSTTRSTSGTAVRSSSGSTTSGTATRSSSSTSSGTTRSSSSSGQVTRSTSSGQVTRSTTSGSTTRSSSSTSSGTTRSSSSGTVTRSGSSVRTSSNVTRGGLTGTVGNYDNTAAQGKETYRDAGGNYRYNDDVRMDDRYNVLRIHPRERDFMPWDRPGYFWGDHPHYYGYRINVLPPQYRRISHWGIDYYYYNGIYYRPFGGVYVICRPPFGTPLEAAIDRAILRVVRFAYYCNTYRTYSTVFDNYNVIAQQNLIIAQNNARIAAQNSAYALNSNRALTAYELANKLGLVQSYAYANSEYFYQDGVFYAISPSGVYTTIVPPAGALVTSLPDDYEVIVMNGIEYFMVDNTVYRTTVFDGEPYLEVLGQMYGSLYDRYNIYR